MNQELKVFTDGGSRGNPGPAASAFVVYDGQDNILKKDSKFLGNKTNNFAEYRALLMALDFLLEFNLSKTDLITFYLDSELVVKQLTGDYKIKSENIIPLALAAKNKIGKLPTKSRLLHVKRNKNKIADQLVNQKLDDNVNK